MSGRGIEGGSCCTVLKRHDERESAGVCSRTFTGHHWPRLKAVLARALKATNDVVACAVSAGIANGTLISVCKEVTNSTLVNI